MDIPKVLFIDDEHNVLNSLRRSLRKNYKDWDIRYVSDAEEAKRTLVDFDPWIIVCEWHLPGDQGRPLIDLAASYCPESVRVLLSGETSQTVALDTASSAHLLVPKPYEFGVICDVLDRANSLRSFPLSHEMRRYIGQIKSLPSLPSTYQQLSRLLEQEEPEIAEISAVINADLGVLTKVLQIANSAYFGSPRILCRAEDAVMRLGVDMVKSLVLVAGLFHSVSGEESVRYQNLLNAALAVAERSEIVAKRLGADRKQREEAYLCGLLHNIGQLVAFECDTLECRKEMPINYCSAVGAYLLRLWYFDQDVIDTIFYFRNPSRSQLGNIIIDSLHIGYASYFSEEQGVDIKEYLDSGYLASRDISNTILG